MEDTILPTGGGPDGKSPIFVPEGTMVSFSIMTLHRRKDLWGEDAEEFRPERWEGLQPGWVSKSTHWDNQNADWSCRSGFLLYKVLEFA